MKICCNCKQSKELGEFHKDKSKPDELSYSCKECKRAEVKARYHSNPDKYRLKTKEYLTVRRQDPEFRLIKNQIDREYYRLKKSDSNWLRNERARIAKWKRDNRAYENARWSAYRAAKLKATPKWANEEKIKEIYMNCPKGMEVDHIIPLQGKNICGLHIETNLQYLTRSENASKSNRWENR